MTKKILSLALALLMLLSVAVFVPVLAADDTVEFNGHTYRRVDIGMTWTEAKAYAENLGGHLVTITSQAENDAVLNLIRNGTKTQYWIGSADSKTWVTGEAWGYTNWTPGEPNGVNGWYAAINNDPAPNGWEAYSGKWHDMAADGFVFPWELKDVGLVVEFGSGGTAGGSGYSWGGDWNVSGSWGAMTLTQSGNTVTGVYAHAGGSVSGTVSGNVLTGTWNQSNDRRGAFEFTMSSDGKTFSVKWNYEGSPTLDHGGEVGTRGSSAPPSTGTVTVPAPPPAAAPSGELDGKWEGTVGTSNGDVWLSMEIFKESGVLKGIVGWDNLPGASNTKPGSFYVTVTYIESTKQYRLDLDKWIVSPLGYGAFIYTGAISGNVFSGTTDGGTRFSVTKKTAPAPPPAAPPSTGAVTSDPISTDVGPSFSLPTYSYGVGLRLFRSTVSGERGIDVTDFAIQSTEFIDVNVDPNTRYYYSLYEVVAEADPLAGKYEDTLSPLMKQWTVTTPSVILGGGSTTPGQKHFILMEINSPKMVVDGVVKEIDPGIGTAAMIINNRTMVPIRAIVEEIGGGRIDWNDKTRTVTVNLNGREMRMTLGSKDCIVNGKTLKMDVAPEIVKGRTLLPIRFFGESLDYTVSYITTKKQAVVVFTR